MGFFAIFSQFLAKIRVEMSFRESERVRQKLEKLVLIRIFGKNRFPKLAKTKILAKALFRRALTNYVQLLKLTTSATLFSHGGFC
jgi:hypothetical protein